LTLKTINALKKNQYHAYARTLLLVSERPYITQSELLQHECFSRPRISKIIKELVNKKFILTKKNPKNKKEYFLLITKSGKNFIREFMFNLQEQFKKALTGFSKSDIAIFKRILTKILKNISETKK
jgi:DNA-binding MarR family transcriptional regulator